ncbi:MAG: L,D-transpeptidase, partial [Candidatus Eisenbacteria bacterium]
MPSRSRVLPPVRPDFHLPGRALHLLTRALARPGAPLCWPPSRLALVDVERQTLTWFEPGEPPLEYRVSTAAAGIGGDEGSGRTPPGWHAIRTKIGASAVPGTVFRSREDSGERWRGER